MLPGYAANPLNATMEISSLRSNDSGTYHCQVVMDNHYERDTVPLVVSGESRHHRGRFLCKKKLRGKYCYWANGPGSIDTSAEIQINVVIELIFFVCFIWLKACCANVREIMTTFNRSAIKPFSALLFNGRVIKLIHHINILMAGLINAARCSLCVCCCSIYFSASALL